MSNRKKIASVAFTGVAAVTAVGFHAGTARAATSWTVTPGGAYAGANSTAATLTANTTTLTCKPTTATAAGNLKTGTVTSSVVGSISTAAFGTTTSPCSTLAGLVKFTAKLNKPINIKATGGTANAVTGKLSGDISATLTGTGAIACHAIVSGSSIPVSFNNSTHLLNVNPNNVNTLRVKSVSSKGCDGVLTSGEAAGFHAIYSTSPSQTIVPG